MTSSAPIDRHRVVIAGGGVAALETALALRALVGSAVELTLLAAGEELHYHPHAVLAPFGRAAVRRYRLDAICADLGVTLRAERLVAVEPAAHELLTADGAHVGYDSLVVAVGARPRATLARACTFFADHDGARMELLVDDVAAGEVEHVAFVVPPGRGWALPLYELALTLAARVRELGVAAPKLTLVTPEDVPLAVFRGAGSDAVAGLLAQAGIDVTTATYVRDYDGQVLELVPGGRTLAADRVVALPVLAGPAIAGLPNDPGGFVHVDEHGRVPHRDGVYAAGDVTTFPIEQGGLAAQQADVVAALVAAAAGFPVRQPRTRPQLRAMLLTGGEPLYLRATISGGESVASSASRDCPWWPPHKIAARHLAPYLADRERLDVAACPTA
jgi:sulfide:quinone oxidoreductase